MIEAIQSLFEREYAQYRQSLREISYDDANDRVLCDREEMFFNYDRIAQKVCRGATPRTPDMLLFYRKTLVFVEFKAGRIDIRRRRDSLRDALKLKGVEGGYIALARMLTPLGIPFEDIFSLPKIFLIVYNEKNWRNRRIGKIQAHQESLTLKMGLGLYEGTFFRRVQALSSYAFLHWMENRGFLKNHGH